MFTKINRRVELAPTEKQRLLSGQSGTCNRDLPILNPVPKPLDHVVQSVFHESFFRARKKQDIYLTDG